LRARIAELETQLTAAPASGGFASDMVDLDDERVLQEVGIYRYHHPLENSVEFKERLAEIDSRVKDMVKAGDAVLASDLFTFNNSLAKGRKMTGEFSKLMLRAYNAEADNCVRSLRAGNVLTAKKRLEASVTAIAKLGSMMEMRVNLALDPDPAGQLATQHLSRLLAAHHRPPSTLTGDQAGDLNDQLLAAGRTWPDTLARHVERAAPPARPAAGISR
jgi:hypothetical protein